MAKDGHHYVSVSSIGHGSAKLTTSGHYSGDPNFPGEFSQEFHTGNLHSKFHQAFTENFMVLVELKGDRIVDVKKVVDF